MLLYNTWIYIFCEGFKIHIVPQERRSIVKSQRGKIHFTISQFHHSCSSTRKEKHSKHQRGKAKRNPPEEYMGISNPKEDLSGLQKEVILRCQRENSAPTKFEIQIWVLNFGCGVEYSNIWRDRFPFARLTFILSRRSGNQRDISTKTN